MSGKQEMLISESDRKDGNHLPSSISLFRRHARDQPDSIACSHGGSRLTYRALELASLSLASAFQGRGITRGDKIPIFLSRSLESVACIIGMLQLGVCFVPIDAESWSQARVDAVLRAINPRIIIISTETALESGSILTIAYEDVKAAFKATSDALQFTDDGHDEGSREEPAYTIFTSGTTGTPKGVVIPRRCLDYYVNQGVETGMPFNMGVTSLDKVLLLFSLGFDG